MSRRNEGEVSVEVEGETITAHYTVDRGLVKVSWGMGSKTTQVGSSEPESIARLLLRELAQEASGG